jgi:hypothetical protein
MRNTRREILQDLHPVKAGIFLKWIPCRNTGEGVNRKKHPDRKRGLLPVFTQ